ncbi:MAG TPA: hypothetical protein VFJ72_15655 [Rubrobacteraceae bacterium]|nr:hypothetical protein [Rubrobacteraceae bacterium]
MKSDTISGMVSKARRPRLFLLAALLAAFIFFLPYLEATGSCGDPGCPQISQAHGPVSGELAAAAIAAILAAAPATPVLAAALIGPRPASDRTPAQVYLSPDPGPPRLRTGGL